MYLSSGPSFFQISRTSCTMEGFCLLYLLMILLMRSGDVETNPGPDRIVSEKELLKLSKQIEPSYYKEVGINLDISIAELGQIEKDSQSTSDALMTVFMRWRDKQPPGTDIRALLAEGLERSDLGSPSGELLTGSLVPTRTGAPVTRPGSHTSPLSPDLIKRCADDFKSKYRTTLCKIRADPLDPDSTVPFTDMYTHLVLEEGYRDHKRPLEYRDLFDLKVNGEFPKRIMVQGEAGTGKTTFCAKIAWDWITENPVLPKFVWVLVVPFREAKQYTIGEIAKSYLSKDNPATACQITEYIRSNPKDIFIAFDGLDELYGKVVQQRKAGSKSECHHPKSSTPTSDTLQPRVNSAEASGSSSERGGIALGDILSSDELATCPVLVTSRPWKVTEIRCNDSLRKLYTFIHVEGFSKANVEVYIHKYFQDDGAKADQLIQLTKDNVIISENMAPYPIYIAMLCRMWRELGDKKQEKLKSFQTFSQIFDEMFEFLKVHYAQKEVTDLSSPSFKDCLSQIEKVMEPVSKVAFIGLQENTLIFKEDDLEQCSNSIETACRVGVLSQEKKLSSMNDKSSLFLQSTIFFPHKLVQEYMAGLYLASLYELDHNEFTRLIEQVVLPRKEEFRYLLYFTVCRDKTIANHVMNCMVQGDTSNQEEIDFLVDVSFESQDLDTAALVRGGTSSIIINHITTAHTEAGYVFTGLYKDVVQTVMLEDGRCSTSDSSHLLVDALCSMPNLTKLRTSGKDFQEEFCTGISVQSKSNEESSSPAHRSDKTTSYPSSPNTRTSTTTPTTAAAATTTSQKAFFVITLLAWVPVTVSGTTPEISSTTGDTVNIPCPFGEGTVRNIFWSYNDGTGPQKILFLAHGNLHKEAEYENRASLQGNISTLILKDITVADEGTYRCDVDRQGLPVVTNITTKLNVFSLRPDTLPVIPPCTGADESSLCIIHANQSFTLTCTLPNVYPVEDTEVIWYQDGKNVSSTHDDTQNDDGTTDISRQIQVSETGIFTCNAKYVTANGKENTVVSVEAWIIPPTDVPNTPGKNVEWVLICSLTTSMLMLLLLAIIFFFKARGRQYYRGTECELNEPQLNEVSAESCKPLKDQQITVPTMKKVAEASSHPIRGDTEM